MPGTVRLHCVFASNPEKVCRAFLEANAARYTSYDLTDSLNQS